MTVRNVTERIPMGGIQKYHVAVDSKWNNYIEAIFADINISRNSEPVVSFRTSSASLNPWETKVLEGFVETDNLEGEYQSAVTLFYSGQQTSFFANLLVYKEFPSFLLIAFILAGLVALLAIIYLLYYFRRKSHKH